MRMGQALPVFGRYLFAVGWFHWKGDNKLYG